MVELTYALSYGSTSTSQSTYNSTSQRFARPITAKDWPRFWFYSKRVSFLRYGDDHQLILHPTVFKELDRTLCR